MKHALYILCAAAGLAMASDPPSERRPHPPTSRPPGVTTDTAVASEPTLQSSVIVSSTPSAAALSSHLSEPHAATKTAGYVVFMAALLLFFRKVEAR